MFLAHSQVQNCFLSLSFYHFGLFVRSFVPEVVAPNPGAGRGRDWSFWASSGVGLWMTWRRALLSPLCCHVVLVHCVQKSLFLTVFDYVGSVWCNFVLFLLVFSKMSCFCPCFVAFVWLFLGPYSMGELQLVGCVCFRSLECFTLNALPLVASEVALQKGFYWFVL